MRAADAGWLLQALARGGTLELSPEQLAMLEALGTAGLARTSEGTLADRERLAALKIELASIGQFGLEGADVEARARSVRTEILELSERVGQTEGATEVRASGSGGPYR